MDGTLKQSLVPGSGLPLPGHWHFLSEPADRQLTFDIAFFFP